MDYQSLHMKTVADLRKLAKDLDVRIPAGTKKNIMIEMLLEADAPTRPEAKNAAPAPAEDKAESDRGAAASVGETENTVESAKDGAAKKGRGARKGASSGETAQPGEKARAARKIATSAPKADAAKDIARAEKTADPATGNPVAAAKTPPAAPANAESHAATPDAASGRVETSATSDDAPAARKRGRPRKNPAEPAAKPGEGKVKAPGEPAPAIKRASAKDETAAVAPRQGAKKAQASLAQAKPATSGQVTERAEELNKNVPEEAAGRAADKMASSNKKAQAETAVKTADKAAESAGNAPAVPGQAAGNGASEKRDASAGKAGPDEKSDSAAGKTAPSEQARDAGARVELQGAVRAAQGDGGRVMNRSNADEGRAARIPAGNAALSRFAERTRTAVRNPRFNPNSDVSSNPRFAQGTNGGVSAGRPAQGSPNAGGARPVPTGETAPNPRFNPNSDISSNPRFAQTGRFSRPDGASARPRAEGERGNGARMESAPELTVEATQVETESRLRYYNAEYRTSNPAVPEMLAAGDCGDGAGVLEIQQDGYGFLRAENCLPGPNDVYISIAQIRRFNLRQGDYVVGKIRPQREGDRYSAMLYITEVNGEAPEAALSRPRFEDLVPIYPDQRLRLEPTSGENDLSLRLIDMLAPIGKGQRGMIVSQPKAGKTTLLKKVANAITRQYPEVHLIVLLIDERPEEVTDMKRSIDGEVIYSTFDEAPENHTRVSEMVLERAQRLVEMRKDVVVLMDSITRLARAYNLVITPTGRSLSGGLDPGALFRPKRFFGAARNIENGGSLTVIATALVETGSRMDDIIYEEFKGTGNMELHLDRALSDRRVFPAIDMVRSGTRREELLLTTDEIEGELQVRRMLSGGKSQEMSEELINLMTKTANNAEFFQRLKGWMAVYEKEGYTRGR